MSNTSVVTVRKAVQKHIGSKVQVRSNLGRHKYDITEGIISEIYPSIFLVKVRNEAEQKDAVVSYSYTDVITEDVQLRLC